jgi:hypothetical protein
VNCAHFEVPEGDSEARYSEISTEIRERWVRVAQMY